MKRFWDILLVVGTLPLWLPVLVLVALAVALAEGRPIWFRQERSGLHGEPFALVKFRSMRLGAGDDSARLTRFGRWLRASSLDELPELFLVLAGKMSLVGPRPLPVRYLERYSPEQRRRLEVRPGITGLAQVNGRNALTWERKFAYDVEYVDHHSLWLDLKILFRTVAAVFGAKGISAAGEATMGEFMGSAHGEVDR